MDAYFKLKFIEEVAGFIFVIIALAFFIWSCRR